MIGWVRKHWEQFKEDEPGRRFQDSYRRNRQNSSSRFNAGRILNIVAGLLLVIVSLFFGWAPGPGLLTFFIGLGMIAGEFRPAAVFLDWAEVRLRKLWRIARAIWASAPPGERALIVLAAAAGVVGLVNTLFYLL